MAIPDRVPSTDGVDLQVHDLGGDGPLLLLCHATGFCGRVWEPAAETLRRRFHCITFDFRAHGASTRPDHGTMAWRGMAEDILAVVDAIGPDGPILAAGHSMGGATLVMAETSRPGTVARAWTYEPILFEGPDLDADGRFEAEQSPISEGARRRRADFADRNEAYDRYASRPPLDRLDPRALRAYVDHGFRDQPDGTVTLACRPGDEAGVFEHHRSGAWNQVPKLTVPFLLAASGDGQRPAEAVIAAGEAFDNVELARYEELSHFGPLEQPERMATDIGAWLLDGETES